jgi:hypothetical protein
MESAQNFRGTLSEVECPSKILGVLSYFTATNTMVDSCSTAMKPLLDRGFIAANQI